MTHVFSLGHLMGRPDCGALADHGVAALQDRFLDHEHGGWYAKVGADGPTTTDKTAYEHAFVVLAAASATAAGRPGGAALLDRALEVLVGRFWDDDAGMVVEQWDRDWTTLDGYRGVNANMHTVEALLSAADVLADGSLRDKAQRILTRVVHDLAAGNQWRHPRALRRRVAPGAGLQRRRARAPVPARTAPPSGTGWSGRGWRSTCARPSATAAPELAAHRRRQALFEASVREGWAVDGAAGFVYTVDWAGQPVVRERMHWVAAEATATAAALHTATGDASYAAWYETFWQHVADHFRDPERGSWRHELSPTLAPSGQTWAGKPDVYHAFQATLFPRLPLAPSLATALSRNLLP